MSGRQLIERLVADARDLVASGFPVCQPGNEVDEYIVPAPKYLALLQSVEAVLAGAVPSDAAGGDAGEPAWSETGCALGGDGDDR